MTLEVDLDCELLDLRGQDLLTNRKTVVMLVPHTHAVFAVERLLSLQRPLLCFLPTHLLVSAIFSAHPLATATSATHLC